jgi:large subunit ribosomal protein L25
MLHLSDIKLPEGVEIPQLQHGPDQDQAIVSVHLIKEVPIEDEEAEAEAGVEEAAAEGETEGEGEGDSEGDEAED